MGTAGGRIKRQRRGKRGKNKKKKIKSRIKKKRIRRSENIISKRKNEK